MLTERWDEAGELFEKGRHLSSSEREGLLRVVDGELAEQIRELWKSLDEASGFLPPPAERALGPTEDYSTPWPEREPVRFPLGTVLGGRYKILDRLGKGGMGEVYKAHDLVLNHYVALKFLKPEAADAPAALARLRNEVRIREAGIAPERLPRL